MKTDELFMNVKFKWQYQNSTSTCFIQKRPVRKGPEGSDTLLYCDPLPPKRIPLSILSINNFIP